MLRCCCQMRTDTSQLVNRSRSNHSGCEVLLEGNRYIDLKLLQDYNSLSYVEVFFLWDQGSLAYEDLSDRLLHY